MKKYPSCVLRKKLLLICFIHVVLATVMCRAFFRVPCWPGDSCISYVPAAARLFSLTHVSDMHDVVGDSLSKLNMRSKEVFVFAIAVAQKLLSDTRSLFPNIFVLILSFNVSAVMVFVICRKLFYEEIALLAWFLFATCLWPYLYILLGAHQPFVLLHFLLAFYFLMLSRRRRFLSLAAGVCAGMMFFSSPTAIMYVPYLAAGFFLREHLDFGGERTLGRELSRAGGLLLGTIVVAVVVSYPDPAGWIRKMAVYVLTSQHANHFEAYRDILSREFFVPRSFRGAGWLWVFRYMFLIAPVFFSAYLLALGLALKWAVRDRKVFPVVMVSLSTPLLVEVAQVAQLGRNYFSWLPGMIFLVCYGVNHIIKNRKRIPLRVRKGWVALGGLLLCGQVIVSCNVLFREIYPARMAAARFRQWLGARGINTVMVLAGQPHNPFVVDVLNDPRDSQQIRFLAARELSRVRDGYVLLPPVRGRTIWMNCVEEDFVRDPLVRELFERDLVDSVAAVSFSTIASSRIWSQEEEVCAYWDLGRGEEMGYKLKQSRAYLLDMRKVWKTGLFEFMGPDGF